VEKKERGLTRIFQIKDFPIIQELAKERKSEGLGKLYKADH